MGERSEEEVDVVAAMVRANDGSWYLHVIEEPAQDGQHFMDVLEPTIGNLIRKHIPGAPKRQKVAFAMEKGGVLDLPQELMAITIGLGWDTDEGECDLDVSAVLLDARSGEVETVFFGNLDSKDGAIKHSGDNLTGEGEGDDEEIKVQLGRVSPQVQQICFIINIYSKGKTFRNVANPYCRVIDQQSQSELCRYSLREAGHENGLIVSKIAREAGNRWGFHALGLPARGRTYKDAIPQIKQACMQDTRKLMERGGTSSLDGAGYATGVRASAPGVPTIHEAPAPARSVGARPPPTNTSKKDCV